MSGEMLNKPEQQLSVAGKVGDMELLIEIAKFEKEQDMSLYKIGWAWRHVRIWPATLDRLSRLGYLDRVFTSKDYIGYRLSDKGKLRIAVGKSELNEKPDYTGLILNDEEIKAIPYFDKSHTWTHSLIESMRAYYCEKATLELIKHICQYQIEKLVKLGIVK